MYYKVVKNNEVVDAISNPQYVYRNNKNGMVLICKDKNIVQGVISYDGSTIYQIKGKKSLHGGYEEVYLEEIAEEEYLELREVFDSYEPENPDEGGNIENPPEENPETPDNPDEPPVNPERPMSANEMTAKIKELEEQLVATKILLGVE